MLHNTDGECADAIAYLHQHCLVRLKESFVALKHRIPQCKASIADLLPVVSRSIALGYDGPLEQLPLYLGMVSLGDLMLVAASLRNDDAAVRHFCDIVVPQVSWGLRKNFATRASPTIIDDVVDQLASHCFEETTKGTNAAMPRLASFLGRSSLQTWLYATATRMLQTALRQHGSFDAVNRSVDMATMPAREVLPDMKVVSDESCKLGEHLRQQLVQVLRETLEAMPVKRRLASILFWSVGLPAARIAQRMRVSRPRVSELLSEARGQFRQCASQCLDQIALESSRSVDEIHELLVAQLGELIRDDLQGKQP